MQFITIFWQIFFMLSIAAAIATVLYVCGKFAKPIVETIIDIRKNQ